jgi:hypothetical protein
MTSWNTEKYVQAGGSKNLADDHTASCMVLPVMHLPYNANNVEQFLQYTVTGDETSVIYMTFKTSVTSWLGKQPSSPTGKEFRAMP